VDYQRVPRGSPSLFCFRPLGPALNILIKLMSIISLVLAPIIEGKGDWPEGMWYYGFIPLAVMLIGTYLVYHFFWRHGIDITQDMGGGGKDLENGSGEAEAEQPAVAEAVEVGAEGDVKEE
jgi:hypothetical protein